MNPYPTTPQVNKLPLPDLFQIPGQARVSTPSEWPLCAKAWREMIIDMEYGGMPPAPTSIRIETLCHARVTRWEGAPRIWTYRIHIEGGNTPFSFRVQVLFPHTDKPVPVIINGDDCWWYATEEVARKVLDSGCALMLFDRTELAEDLGSPDCPDKFKRSGGLYDVFPEAKFGALTAWVWGYHRCVDLIHQLPYLDHTKIAVTGHSRGGKTTLIAGATDERITLINDNASCAGGSACFRYVGDSGETIDILNVFPSWFGQGLRPYIGREEEIPFDQHCLLATLAPRPLLLTYALGDRWSNPEGMIHCVEAAREAYQFLGQESNIAYHLRPGGHLHDPADWDALLDFINWKWNGQSPTAPYNQHPYTHL